MIRVALFAVLALASAAGGQQVPSCLEDGSSISLKPSDVIQGSLTNYSPSCGSGATLSTLSTSAGLTVAFLAQPLTYLLSAPEVPGTSIVTFAQTCNATVVCKATIMIVAAYPTPVPTAAPTTTSAPPAACGTSIQTVAPGKGFSGLLSSGNSQCAVPLKGAITSQPPADQGGVIVTNGVQYYFAAPSASVMTSFTYQILCDTAVVCADTQYVNVYLPTPAPTPAPPLSRCPKDQIVVQVNPNVQISDVLDAGVVCASQSGVVASQSNVGLFVFSGASMRYIFQAPPIEADVLVQANVLCGGVATCQTSIGIVVTSLTPAPTPAPSTPQPTPTPSPPTPAPTTPTPIPQCTTNFNYTIAIGTQMLGQLNVPIATACPVETYVVPTAAGTKGQFVVNLLGNFLYAPANSEGIDFGYVDVYCINTFVCRSSVMFTVYRIVTPAPTPVPTFPTAAPTPAPLAVCANVYYYYVRSGQILSNSLRGMPGEDACAYGRTFTLIRDVSEGTLMLTPVGDFTFQAPNRESFFDFGFQMTCRGAPYCQGSAYLQSGNSITPQPSQVQTLPPVTPTPGGSTLPPTQAPSVVLPNAQMTCRGTCSDRAWKALPNQPNVWDDTPGLGYARSDGAKVGSVDVAWNNGSLVVKLYALIGNLGVRFPTFEPITSVPGTFFTAADVAAQAQLSSVGFQQSCLDGQVRYGLGNDVWTWTSLANATGRVGSSYASGKSWYQKFGGKHINCDTFMSPCQYAPLLTPNALSSSNYGMWTVDINDCDATWTGTFSTAALQTLKTVSGANVFSFSGPRQLKGVVYSEAVKASSWLEPTKGFDSKVDASSIAVDLRQYVAIREPVVSSTMAYDYEWFEYLDDNGDWAFGINLLAYPFVPIGATQRYAADRHVQGYKWLSQSWMSPSDVQCPSCTGLKMKCATPQQFSSSTYLGTFPTGDCPAGSGRIFLSKGPSMSAANCSADPMHVFDRQGFAPTRNCTNNYQNLTLRGVAVGSRALTPAQRNAFSFEGTVLLQLLLDNGEKPIVALDLSLFVSRLAKNVFAQGELGLCRASPYWPVLDPYGSSTPDQPLPLSGSAPGYLCTEMLDRNFGPSGWVTMYLSLPGLAASQVNVKSIRMRYNTSNIVFLYYKDPSTGLAAIPPPSVGQWWQRTHPFLNFRSLSDRLANSTVLSTDPNTAPPLTTVPFAFTFTPGTISIDTTVEIVVAVTITTIAADGTVINNDNTFTRYFHVDPVMTAETRNGPRVMLPKRETSTEPVALVVPGTVALIAAAVAAVLIFWKMSDNDKPLPVFADKILGLVFYIVPDSKKPADEEMTNVNDPQNILSKLGDVSAKPAEAQ